MDDITALNEELVSLRGSHMTAVEAHSRYFSRGATTAEPSQGEMHAGGAAGEVFAAGGCSEIETNFGVAVVPTVGSEIDSTSNIGDAANSSTASAMMRRVRAKSTITTAAVAAPGDDIWLNIQRYRQCVRDSQEALCVLISEHMDLEMHQQILANKVHALFTSTTQAYAHEQAACLVDQHNDFAAAMNGFISRMRKIGPPHPVLQSPFAKLQEAFVTSDTSTGSSKLQRSESASDVEDYVHKESCGVLSTEGTPIKCEDFASSMGVFSFTKLYRDPLPSCPGVLLSGDVEWLKAAHIGTSYEKLKRENAWHRGYLVASSDGFVHLINRRKCNIPDLSFYLKVRFNALLIVECVEMGTKVLLHIY